jgi:hypothetical protein
MKKFNDEEIAQVLKLHAKFLKHEDGGVQANLRGANLQGANLQGANLQEAYFRGANLRGANLQGAYLQGANLQWANLQGANLQGANLQWAYLQGANLQEAYFRGAYLRGANLQGANLPDFLIVPEEGSFIAWKKLRNAVIAKLEIPNDAQRASSLCGRKCRASFAKVLELSSGDVGIGSHDGTLYKIGETVKSDKWDGDIRVECTNGIHFFMTKKEAEEYNI